MSDTYHHGVSITESAEGPRPLESVKTSNIGMVVVADDADGAAFPLNTPVLVTDVRAAIAKAGDEGSFAPSLEAIAAQTSPLAVVVRVAEGDDAGDTEDNIIAGIAKLRTAEQVTGVRPRILGVPQYDTEAVTNALIPVAQQLRGMVYAGCDAADTVAEAVTYAGEFGQRELMLIYRNFKNGVATRNAIAVALGLRARLDEEIGWHKTLSNIVVNGVTGVQQPLSFDLQDPDTDAGVLNAGNVTALIRSNGYRFWGNRTCAEDPLFAFESAVRTNQVLRDTIAEGIMWAIDKPLSPGLARDILETINAKFRNLKARGLIIGAEARLDTELNTADQLNAGKLYITYDYTPVPPLENLLLRPVITDRFFVDFLERAAA